MMAKKLLATEYTIPNLTFEQNQRTMLVKYVIINVINGLFFRMNIQSVSFSLG
jgi:hypothetical protein